MAANVNGESAIHSARAVQSSRWPGSERILQRLLPAVFGLLVGALIQDAVKAQTVVGAVDCARLSARSSIVEKDVCATPLLAQLDREIDDLSQRLETALSAADKETLVDTERPFLRERNGCQNPVASTPEYRARVHACIERVLTERRDTLRAAFSSPAVLQDAIVQYANIDGPFFRKYADRLLGKRVAVFGCMMLAAGHTPGGRIHATIYGASCDATSGPSVTVLFKSMNADEAYFLDSRTPSSFWQGTVELRDGQAVLYLENVLGTPLP